MKHESSLSPPTQCKQPFTPSVTTSILAGGFAGTVTDVSTYPLDTIKTRLQSSAGFSKGGGWKGLYCGILPIFIGSAPQAAAFFACYNSVKKLSNSPSDPYTHMIGSTCGELMACIFRVPTENVKQKMQVGLHTTMRGTYRSMLATDGFMGFFVGFGATALRDVPFSFIQFPLWEFFKKTWSKYLGKRRKIYSYESALCGSAAGAVAAFLTTPTDVVKTRLMLGHDIKGVRYVGTINTMARIAREEGVRALFAGVVSRVIWISIGGITFFGGYELVLEALEGEMHIY